MICILLYSKHLILTHESRLQEMKMNELKMNIGRAPMNDPVHKRRFHRSVPAVHDITTLEAHQLRHIPTPTTMTKLPSVSSRAYHQKLLAKVVGLDPMLLDKATSNLNAPSPVAR